MPHKTRFHELAHVLLGHTAEGVQADGEVTPRNLRECEAEAVALLCLAALELPGVADSRESRQLAVPRRVFQNRFFAGHSVGEAGHITC